VAIFARGVKYAEEVRDHSKSAVSVIFCGSATGDLTPLYIIYKGLNCYPGWCEGGPDGTVYTSTPSGWADTFTFTDFFKKVFLPKVMK